MFRELLDAVIGLGADNKVGEVGQVVDGKPFILKKEGYTVDMMDSHLPFPDRKRVGVNMVSVESFIGYVNEQKTENTRIFATVDKEPFSYKACIDYHGTGETDTDPSWCTHEVLLSLTPTPEWTVWRGSDKKSFNQEDFAEFLEENQVDITDPSGADILEVASSLEATKGINFKSTKRLEDGQTSLLYDEEMAAKAGINGEMDVPTKFKLSIPIFLGTEKAALAARFRYRLGPAGALTFMYRLIRPALMLEDIVEKISKKIGNDTELPVYHGSYGKSSNPRF